MEGVVFTDCIEPDCRICRTKYRLGPKQDCKIDCTCTAGADKPGRCKAQQNWNPEA